MEPSPVRERPAVQPAAARRWPWFPWLALALAVASAAYSGKQYPSDVRQYRIWITRGWPSWTENGPYPLGVDAVWWPLRFVHADNVNPSWVLLWTGPATLLACVLLWRTASRPHLAVGVWLLAAAAMERSYWLRLEPVSAVIALAALVAARRRLAGTSAAALTAGALIKVWPAFLAPLTLLLTPARRRLRWLVVFAIPWVAYLVVLYLQRPPGGLAWAKFVVARPIQIESFTALGPLWAVGLGSRTWRVHFLNGINAADVVSGPHLTVTHLAIEVVGLAALAVLAVRLSRAHRHGSGVPLDQALLAQVILLLVLIVAGPVFSPQYMAWFAPVLAVAAGEGLLGREAALYIVCCGLTALDYPLGYDELRQAHLLAIVVLTLRDAAVVALLVTAWVHLWHLTRRPAPAPAAPAAI